MSGGSPRKHGARARAHHAADNAAGCEKCGAVATSSSRCVSEDEDCDDEPTAAASRAELEPEVYACDACDACGDVCAEESCPKCLAKRRVQAAMPPVPVARQEGRRRGAAAGQSFTLCQVRRHASASSCWLVAGTDVYDVTTFLARHPAGTQSIVRHAGGRDCSDDVQFHSFKAQKLWETHRIGKLVFCPSDESGAPSAPGGGPCVVS
ncbi:hypothetical protein M885DRAFT_527001 [Pelagophyceae sp. CCMP2097]|nr:hypothetical protein M885DRAFT_527001 [Pelagophyceae sp. CCMP2097]